MKRNEERNKKTVENIRAIFQGKRSQVFRFTHINCAMCVHVVRASRVYGSSNGGGLGEHV